MPSGSDSPPGSSLVELIIGVLVTVAAHRMDRQLTEYTDLVGNPQPQADATHVCGPYLNHIPPIPSGPNKGSNTISDIPAAGVGWVCRQIDAHIRGNTGPTVIDSEGVVYMDY